MKSMKLNVKMHIVFKLLMLICVQNFAQDSNKPLRVFLIGNSFSQNATRYLPELAKEGGHQLELGRAELGGCSLQRHWDSVAINLQDSTRGKPYGGRSLKQLLSQGRWDLVTIQQYSLLSSDESSFNPYARQLYDFIKQIQPNAEVVMHQTWAYRADAKNFGRKKGNEATQSQKEMWEYSRAAYHSVAKQLGIRVIPTGDAFYAVTSDENRGFQKDTSFDHDNPSPPQLPAQHNSINIGYTWTKENKLNFDANHANDAGCYLGGLVWYGFFFREDPSKLKFKPASVSDEFAPFLKQVAWKTVQANKKKGKVAKKKIK
jgi:hypothetical protein